MVQITVGEPLGVGTGKISAKDFDEQAARELSDAIAAKYLVDVDAGTPGSCIDGRNCRSTMGETGPKPAASVAGGPAITAYAAAEMVPSYFGAQSGATSTERMHDINLLLEANGIKIGAHVSRGAVDNGFKNPDTQKPQTGCGASDEFIGIINQLQDAKTFVEGGTALLLGGAYNPGFMQFRDHAELVSRVQGYDPKTALDEIIDDAQPAGDTPRGANVEILEGAHAEVLVVFNYLRDKTVDRDRLVAETGKQVFVVDMWYIDDIATAMAVGRPDAVEMREKLRHAMVAYQVGTYAQLCDGTHRPIILQTQEAAVGATV